MKQYEKLCKEYPHMRVLVGCSDDDDEMTCDQCPYSQMWEDFERLGIIPEPHELLRTRDKPRGIFLGKV